MRDENAPGSAWFRIASSWALVAYWIAIFAGTHWPKLTLESYPTNFDKVLHITGYGGLSMLIAVWLAGKRDVTLRDLACIFAVMVAYSIFDELTQIPVGRTCDKYDAFADWAGSACALTLFFVFRRTVRRIATA